MNLLMQVDGRLDQKKAAMIEEIDRYLSLSREQKAGIFTDPTVLPPGNAVGCCTK